MKTVTEQEYNKHEGIRRSDLWKVKESPEKYLWAVWHPEQPTPSLIFGAMVHKLLLQPDTFVDEYAIMPEIDRRTSLGKEEWERFYERSKGKTGVKLADYNIANDMVSAVTRHPIAKKLLSGQVEQPFFWTDEDTGEKLKCRLDILTELDGKPVVVDYKTANSAETNRFNNDIWRYGYALQAYMYTEAVMKHYKLDERPRFVFIVQEKKAPYAVNCIEATEDVMTAGMDTFRELIGILHQCLETGYWYGFNGPYDDLNEAYLPGWMTMGEEDEE